MVSPWNGIEVGKTSHRIGALSCLVEVGEWKGDGNNGYEAMQSVNNGAEFVVGKQLVMSVSRSFHFEFGWSLL